MTTPSSWFRRSVSTCCTILVIPLLSILLLGTGSTLQYMMIVFNKVTFYEGEINNSNQYNAVLRLINMVGLNSPGGLNVLHERIQKNECYSLESLRSGKYTKNQQLKVLNNDHYVEYTETVWDINSSGSSGSDSTPDLTIFYAHGGGMVTGCRLTYQYTLDSAAELWMDYLSLKSIRTVNIEFRNLPQTTMVDSISDFLSVYTHYISVRQMDSSKAIFEGCSGGGSMVLFSYLQMLQKPIEYSAHLPKLILSHSPGPGLENVPSFTPWEGSHVYQMNIDHSSTFFFSNDVGQQWGKEWDEESRTTLTSWLSDRHLMGKLGKEVIVTSAEHEVFHHPHEEFMKYLITVHSGEQVGVQYLSFPNRTHCLQALEFTMFTGPEGINDQKRIFKSIRNVWEM